MVSLQVGLIAAAVVLFVPMLLAGYHLSRNKVLFFSGALFLSLAVTVHLTPFFPPISRIILFPISSSYPAGGRSCLPQLHRIDWSHPSSSPLSWSWAPRPPCAFNRLSSSDASVLLNNSWVVVAGDSQARLLVLALLRLLLSPEAVAAAEPELFRRHSDYAASVPSRGIKVDFIWAPFEANLTHLVRDRLRLSPRPPDVLVLGSGLWHLLHITDADDYGSSLSYIHNAVVEVFSPPLPPPHFFWIGMPRLITHLLNTEEKRERMNETMVQHYDLEVDRSKLLQRAGGPFLLLDVGTLTSTCGERCTDDGMHYDSAVYEAMLHIMLNALVVESQQQM